MLWDTIYIHVIPVTALLNQEDMVQAAIQHGLDGICFTDHIDYDYPKNRNFFYLIWILSRRIV